MSGLSRFGDAEACLVAITVPGGGALLRGAATVFPKPPSHFPTRSDLDELPNSVRSIVVTKCIWGIT